MLPVEPTPAMSTRVAVDVGFQVRISSQAGHLTGAMSLMRCLPARGSVSAVASGCSRWQESWPLLCDAAIQLCLLVAYDLRAALEVQCGC
jgi:hypothetical protein